MKSFQSRKAGINGAIMNSKRLAGYGAATIIGFCGLLHGHSAAARQVPADAEPTPGATAPPTEAPPAEAPPAEAPPPSGTWRANGRLRSARSRQAQSLPGRLRGSFYRERRAERRSATIEHKVARLARKFVGRYPYVYGGDSVQTGFDCSGLTHYLYGHFGRTIPRTAEDQYLAARELPWSAARPGDLVFFHDGDYVYHVAVYEGRNRIVTASNEAEGIRFQRIWTRSVTFGTLRG